MRNTTSCFAFSARSHDGVSAGQGWAVRTGEDGVGGQRGAEGLRLEREGQEPIADLRGGLEVLALQPETGPQPLMVVAVLLRAQEDTVGEPGERQGGDREGLLEHRVFLAGAADAAVDVAVIDGLDVADPGVQADRALLASIRSRDGR
jgi:hypothetical protein